MVLSSENDVPLLLCSAFHTVKFSWEKTMCAFRQSRTVVWNVKGPLTLTVTQSDSL